MARPGVLAGAAAALALAMTLDQVVPGGPQRPTTTYVAALGAVVAAAVVFYLFALWAERSEAVARHRRGFQVVYLGLAVPVVGGVAQALGGIEHAYWASLLLVVVAAGIGLPVRTALPVPALAGVALLVGAAVDGSLVSANVGSLSFACLFFFLISVFLSSSLSVVRGYARFAVQERFELREEVARLSAQLARAAEGDLTVRRAEGNRHAELGELGDAFNTMLESLQGLVLQIRDGGEQISASSTELLATAEEHAAAASQQASAVSETTTTIEELA
ncbi:MAG: HAMP domain-containing protein, partial [Mycobacteriales bacterium]